jgi:hypothetical protein
MIEVLESLQYKTNQDLTTIGVSANNVSLPTYSQTEVGGRYTYSNTFIPQYLEGAVNYQVANQTDNEKLIRDFIALKSSYSPVEFEIDYLSTTIYDKLPTVDIAFYIYWYDVVNTYSITSVTSELSTKALYGTFSDEVGYLMLYSPSPETVVATALNSTGVKPYNRTIESLIPDELRDSFDQAYKDSNSSYAENTTNIATGADPTTAHGSRLVVDASNNSRYTSASSTYLSTLVGVYHQLMYLSPLYATMLQSTSLTSAPFFTTTIEGSAVVVDKFGNKVNTNQGWSEMVMLSAYTEE